MGPLLVPRVNGSIPKTNAKEGRILKTASCTVKVPAYERKPSLSNINIPCYHRRPSGQALDINFDYTFTVMYGRYTKDLGRYALEEVKKKKKKKKRYLALIPLL